MIVPRMRPGAGPAPLSQRLAGLGVGDETVVGASKDRVRATIQGSTTWMNIHHPERQFELGRMGDARTHVRRVMDLAPADWAEVWARCCDLERGVEAVVRTSWTYVPRRHGFAMWARERGLGVTDGEWWAWEHVGGWRVQKAVQGMLRKAGTPARTWSDRSKKTEIESKIHNMKVSYPL